MIASRKLHYRILGIITLIALALALFTPAAYGKEGNEDAATKDLSAIVDKTGLKLAPSSNKATVTKGDYAGDFKFALKHEPEKNGIDIKDGDSLSISVVAKDPNLDFLRFTNKATNTVLKDKDSQQELADVRYSGNTIYFTFKDVDLPFKANGSVSLFVSDSSVEKYFKDHPRSEKVDFTYEVQVNGKPAGVEATWTLTKPSSAPPTAVNYKKLSGGYSEKSGDQAGRGTIYYEIQISTLLRHHNEMVIYDMPDANLELDKKSNLAVYFSPRSGYKNNTIYNFGTWNYPEKCKSYAGSDECKLYGNFDAGSDPDNSTELFLTDVYYVTEDPVSKVASRMAGYEEKTIKFPRHNIIDGTNTVTSAGTITAPKNIILEKPAKAELTEAEQQLIDEAGGLHKTVGKGFKLRIKNHRNDAFEKGGHIILAFNMRVVNDSLMVDGKGNPLYFNAFSYYGQEIPNCDPQKHDNCTPIKVERMTPDQVKAGQIVRPATPPGIVAETDKYQHLNFTKQDPEGKPLAGAKFTIYKATSEGKRGEVAENQDGVKLENLITDAAGKLRLPNGDSPLEIKVLRGNYVLAELEAPKGYQLAEDPDTLISVQVAKKDNVVVNHPVPAPNPPVPNPPAPNPPAPNPPAPNPPAPNPPASPTVPAAPEKQSKPIAQAAKLPRTGAGTSSLAFVAGMLVIAGMGLLYKRRW